MKDNILNLLKNSINDFIYEIDIHTKEIIWHKDINTYLGYSNKTLKSFDDLTNLIHVNDKKKFQEKINYTGKTPLEISYKIKTNSNKYQTHQDKFIYYKSDNEEKILGVCKDISNESIISLKLEEQKETTENILDSTKDLVFYKNKDFVYIGCNEAFCNFVGLEKKDILGKNDFELFPEEFALLFRSMDIKMLENKEPRTNKEWVKFPDGKDVLLLTQKSPLINRNNEIYGLLGISRDITKEIEYKKEIKENKKSYQQLFEANRIPVLLINLDDGKIIKANQAALKFYGYSKKEIKELEIYDINILSKDEIKDEMERAKNEHRECFYFKHRLKNKKVIDVEVYSGPIQYDNKTILYSLIFDISKRKIAEKRLKQAHTIYQNTKEGIFITDLKGIILSVNKAFEEITEYTEEEVINKEVNILKSDTHKKVFYKAMWNSLKQKGSWEGEIVNKTKSGKIFPQWLTINAVYDEYNKPIKYVAVFTDFTKLKEQEELLRQKDQIMFQQSKMAAMGEMLRNIAHQWRQPLSVISSSATGLKLKKEFGILNDEDFVEFADGILKSSNYLSETIEDFSNYFKNDKNQEFFYISEVINKTYQLSESSLKNADIEFNTKLEEDIEIYGIKNELIQVILNIVNNSKDAFKNIDKYVKSLKIETKKEHSNLIISIKDNAGGIKEEILNKIFEPYFTTKHQSQGTGIGLYMSQQIVQERLEGNIDVYNITQHIDNIEYKGVEFKIIIPLPKQSNN